MKKFKRKVNDEYASRGSFTGAIIILAAVFLVTVLNFIVLANMLSNQVVDLGNQNTNNMKNTLQNILDEASYMTRAIAAQTQDELDSGITESELRNFITETAERQRVLTDGNCMNVCYTAPGTIIVPGTNIADDFDINSRTWYQGLQEYAKHNDVGNASDGDVYVYVSEPYVDLATGDVCFTTAALLSDGITTISLDFTMDRTQSLILSLGEDKTESYIVNSEGLLVGCYNEEYLGTKASDHYPYYVDVIKSVGKDTETIGHFSSSGKTVFYCNADNKWFLVSVVDQQVLFRDTYISLTRNAIISSLLLIGIVVLLIWNINGRKKVQKALDDRENFFNNISGELRQPVTKILHESNPRALNESVDVNDNMKNIRESAMKLSGLVDNILAYSGIGDAEEKSKKKDKKKHKIKIANIRIGGAVIVIISVCIGIIFWFTFRILQKQADSEMQKRVEADAASLSEWMSERKTATDMLADAIESNPSILDDYDKLVEYLASVQEKSADVELIYIGKEGNDPCVAMSDAWLPGMDYVVQAYSWYYSAVDSEYGYAISQPYFDTTVRAFCITISEPLYSDKGEFLGVLGMDYSIDELTAEFESEYSEEGYTFLVASSGLIVNHPNQRYAISTSNRVDVRDLNYSNVLNKDGYIYIRDYDGRDRLCISKRDDISGFRVFSMCDSKYLFMQTGITALVFIILMSVCLIITVIVWRRITKWYEEGNEKLREAAEKATEADKAKMQFLAQISHELRTPINAVLGMDELITRECDDETIVGYAEDIQTAGHNLLELVNGLLDFSKIENGKMTLQEVEYSTDYMLRETLNTVTERANKAGLQLIVNIDENISSLLYGDDMKIRQVVVNLLTNAIKYTPSGSVTLTVSERERIDDTVLLYFSVKDTGIGIKPEDRDNLFKSFSRVDQEKNRSIEGTGLGLYIVNKILSMMNTKLELDSVYGKGSDFYFVVEQKVISTLPIGEFSMEQSRTAKKVIDSADYVYAPEAKIMVVDDNAVNLKVAAGLLKRSAAKVATVNSGKACLELLRNHTYDIIFLDHMMPNMDGTEVLRRIREEDMVPETCPVIVMTANAITGARDEYINMGFDDYISKPIDVAVLEDALKKWIPEDKKQKKPVAEEAEGSVKNSTKNVAVPSGDKTEVTSASNSEVALGKESETPGVFIFEMDESEIGDGNDGPDEFSPEELKYFEEKLTEINPETGLGFAGGSKEFYLEIVRELIATDSGTELQKHYDEENYDEYRIKVHAMKNNLKTIGATELGELAYKLELAGKNGDIACIKDNNDEFLRRYNELMELLNPLIK